MRRLSEERAAAPLRIDGPRWSFLTRGRRGTLTLARRGRGGAHRSAVHDLELPLERLQAPGHAAIGGSVRGARSCGRRAFQTSQTPESARRQLL
eukprot:147835-Prorocentrum_minimum.AAC.1